jgi:4-alpha-glucanotransferase
MSLDSKAKRLAGVAVPVQALRSASSEGVGDFLDLVPFGEFCAKAGMGVVQILPVNDSGTQSSPYSARSAFALHPLLIRLSALPEAAGAEYRGRFEALEALARFDYQSVRAKKLALASEIFDEHYQAIASDAELDRWIKRNSWAPAYGLFCALKEEYGERAWYEWPEHGAADAKERARLAKEPARARRIRFHLWLQMRLEEQFAQAAAALKGMGIVLKGDIPILMNDDSAEVWSSPWLFRRDLRVGAPPDMFTADGQNWGFPAYDWGAIEAEGYAFWKSRLSQAAKFYGAYRLDHVLGFFRVWAIPERRSSGRLGRFLPGEPVSREELRSLGFDDARIRWLSEPHVPSWRLGELGEGRGAALEAAFERIGDEDLYLFKPSIRGEKDIDALPIEQRARELLRALYSDRVLDPMGDGLFAPAWYHRDASAWRSLSDGEREALSGLFSRKRAREESVWEEAGMRILSVFRGATKMLCCAEDLGAVPDCVPRVLSALGILGLKIPRWARRWAEPGQPAIEFGDYPELSVCASSVHDTSTMRGWWELEEGREELWARLGGKGPCPTRYEPAVARMVLEACARSGSRLFIAPIQDYLHLAKAYYSKDPRDERINVPGVCDDFNWTWRLPACSENLAADAALTACMAEIAALRKDSSGATRRRR